MQKAKDPRIVVSSKRHEALAKEAKKLKISMSELAERKFKAAK